MSRVTLLAVVVAYGAALFLRTDAQPAPTPPPIMPDKYHTYNSPVVMANASGSYFAVMWSYPIPNTQITTSTMYSFQMSGGSTWQQYPLPVTLYAASGGAAIGTNVYSFGGSVSLNVDPLDSVYQLQIDNNGDFTQSMQCASLPVALASVTAVTYGKQILLVGGYSVQPVGDVVVFDPSGPTGCVGATYTSAFQLHVPRAGVAAGMIGTKLVVAGGTVKGGYDATVEFFDMDTKIHVVLNSLPNAVGSPAGVVANCLLYVLGGSAAQQSSTAITAVTVTGQSGYSFPFTASLQTGRAQFSALAPPYGDITAFGGYGGASNEEVVPCPAGFTGPDCFNAATANCTYGYYRPTGTTQCLACPGMNSVTCGGPCNGHGTCQPSGANLVCSCEQNFDPSVDCASCIFNFAGPSCMECATNFYGSGCLACPKTSGGTCNGHGHCNDGVTGNGTCSCSHPFTGAHCDECLPGFFGSDCTQCTCDSSYGTCDDGIDGTGACSCYPGFSGDCRCATAAANGSCTSCPPNYVFGTDTACLPCPGALPVPGHNGSLSPACYDHGTCTFDGLSSAAMCTCNASEPYTGPSCLNCTMGYTRSLLETECHACPGVANAHNTGKYSGGLVSVICNYHGQCSPIADTGVCLCQSGDWSGDECCTWVNCPSVTAWGFIGIIVGVVLGLLVLVMAWYGPRMHYVTVMLIPGLQVMAASATHSAVRFLAIASETRPLPLVNYFTFQSVTNLRQFLTGLGVPFGFGFMNWQYLAHCAAPAPTEAELWAVPALGPIIFAVLYLIVLVAKYHKPSQGDQDDADEAETAKIASDDNNVVERKPIFTVPLLSQWIQGIFFAVLFFYVTIALNAFSGLRCSNRDFCDPNRLPILCAGTGRFVILAFSGVCFALYTLAFPGVIFYQRFPFLTKLLQPRKASVGGEDSVNLQEVLLGEGEQPQSKFDVFMDVFKPLDKFQGVLKPKWTSWVVLQCARRVALVGVFAFDLSPYILIGVTLGTSAIALAVCWWFNPHERKVSWLGKAEMAMIVLEAWCLVTVALIPFVADYVDAHPPKGDGKDSVPSSKSSQATNAANSSIAAGALGVVVVSFSVFIAWYGDRPSAAVHPTATAKAPPAALAPAPAPAPSVAATPAPPPKSRSTKKKSKPSPGGNELIASARPSSATGAMDGGAAPSAPIAFAPPPAEWSALDPVAPLPDTVPIIAGVSQGGDGIGMLPVFNAAPKKKGKRNSKGKRSAPQSVHSADRDELDEDMDVPYPLSNAISPASGVSPDAYRPSALDHDDQSSYSSIPDLKYDEDQRCANCGVQVRPNYNYCHNCGRDVSIDSSVSRR